MTIIIIIAAIYGFSKVIRLIKQKNDVQKAMMLAIKAEQIRQANASARAWEKQRAADEKRDAKIRQHDDAIQDLQYRLEQVEATVSSMDKRLAGLDAKLDYLLQKQEGTATGGDEWLKYQDKILTVENQIAAAEAKRRKAINDKRVCLSKMEVA